MRGFNILLWICMLQALNTKSFLYETGDCMLHQATMGLASPLSTSGQSDPRWRPASSAGSLQSRFICGKHSVPAACFKGPAGRREGRSTRRRGTPRAAEPSAHAGPQSRSPQAAPQSPPHLSLATRGVLRSQTNTALWWSRAGPLHMHATHNSHLQSRQSTRAYRAGPQRLAAPPARCAEQRLD